MPYSEADMTAVRLERDKNWNSFQAEIQEHKKTAVKLDEVKQDLSEVKKTLKEQRDIVASLSEQIATTEKQSAAYKGEVTKKETEIAVLQARLEDMESGKEINWSRFTSRKFIGALLAVLLPVLNQQFGWQLDATQMLVILSPLLAFIGFEGWTDHVERTA
jgi:septal ring factor EnvC (AmiA/AmiB activator)